MSFLIMVSLGNVCTKSQDGKLDVVNPDKIAINGTIHGTFLDLLVSQSYTNNSDNSQIFEFIFSDDNSCMYGAVFHIGEEKIQLVVQEKNQAQSTYSEAIKKGKTAVIGRSLPEKLKEFQIGNVPPHVTCNLEVHFGFILQIHEDNISFSFPLTLTSLSDKPLNISSLSSQFSLTINTNRSDIISVLTNDLEFTTTKDDSNNIIISSNVVKNSNCQIELKCSNPLSTEGYFAAPYGTVLVVPPTDLSTKQNNSDFIFIIDCSGSMSGSRIRAARECLGIFVKSLPKDCCFEIIRFGSNAQNLFNKLEPYSPESMRKAVILAENLQADLGGTEILRALKRALELPERPGHPVQVFLITDGEDWGRDASIKYAQSQRHKTRIFALGISNEADRGLVQSLAEATGGASDIILGNDIAEKTIRLLKTARTAAISQLALQLENGSPETVPFPIPVLYFGSYQTLFFKTDQNPQDILISGKCASDEIDIPTPLINLDEDAKNCLCALYAQQGIKDFEREMEKLTSDKRKEMEKKIIELSISSGILSQFTAFVGVSNQYNNMDTTRDFDDDDDDDDDGCCEKECCDDDDDDGCCEEECCEEECCEEEEEEDDDDGCCEKECCDDDDDGCCEKECCDDDDDDDDGCCEKECCDDDDDEILGCYDDNDDDEEFIGCCEDECCFADDSGEIEFKYDKKEYITKKEEEKPQKEEKHVNIYDFNKIVMMQDFNGNWNNINDVLSFGGLDNSFMNQSEVQKILKLYEDVSKGNNTLDQQITATLLALAILQKKSLNRKDAWSILEENALSWLNSINTSKNWNDIINNFCQLIN